jgi:hypothetical protein
VKERRKRRDKFLTYNPRTNDAGFTIHKVNVQFNKIMQKTSKALNLKPHVCGGVKGKTKKLSSAADIEGHLGTDKKVIFPPLSSPPFLPFPFTSYPTPKHYFSFICWISVVQCLLHDQILYFVMVIFIVYFDKSTSLVFHILSAQMLTLVLLCMTQIWFVSEREIRR